jgi:hypothetical protein
MPDLAALAARLSVARILAWAALFFVVLSFPLADLVPAGTVPAGPGSFIMGMPAGDPRIVERHYPPDPGTRTIAWITDSSPTILKPRGDHPDSFDRVGLLQDTMLERNSASGGGPLRFAAYMQIFGPKAIDKYFEAQHAISLKPDLLVYGVNPTFDFTSWNMMGEEAVPGALASFGTGRSWGWALLFASPSQLLQGLAMRVLPAMERRYELGKVMDRVRRALDPFGFGGAAPPGKPSPVGTLMFYRAWREGLLPPFDANVTPSSQHTQLTAMRLMDTGEHAWGKAILRDLARDLRESGTPALIYMIPVNVAVIEKDPIAAANFHAIERWYAEFAAQYNSETLRILPQTPTRSLPGLTFFDVSHLTNAQPFADYFLAEILQNAQKNKTFRPDR